MPHGHMQPRTSQSDLQRLFRRYDDVGSDAGAFPNLPPAGWNVRPPGMNSGNPPLRGTIEPKWEMVGPCGVSTDERRGPTM